MLTDTKAWDEYQQGIDYKNRINLYSDVSKAENMYSGSQWVGVNANGLPTPVFNVIQRVIDYKISNVMAENIDVKYAIENLLIAPPDKQEELFGLSELLNKWREETWERLKMDASNEYILKDAAISGDGITYYYWDDNYKAPTDLYGVPATGEMCKEEIDNVNYYPGNPNDHRVQQQPYIIIASRKLVSDLKKEAKANGVPADEIQYITSDSDTEYQSGDRSKIELSDSGKCTVLLRLWRDEKTRTIWASKSTRSVEIRKAYDTKLRRYPLAVMNYKYRKNCCHGVSEVAGLIPNQLYINKIAAMIMLHTMSTAFPRVIYDATRVDSPPTNQIGKAWAVTGDPSNVISVSYPANAANDSFRMFELSIQQTKELMGASDAALGDVSPTNTSAIIAVTKSSSIPLESIRRRLYQYVEDVSLIWLDFWLNKYANGRLLTVKDEQGNPQTMPFNYDAEAFKDLVWNAKIDVGPGDAYSEATSRASLDNMLMNKVISPKQYVERLPAGTIPKLQQLIDEFDAMDSDKQMTDAMLTKFVQSLPPEVQAALQQMKPDEMEQLVRQWAMMPDEELAMELQQYVGGGEPQEVA